MRTTFTFLIILFFSLSSFAQVYTGTAASKYMEGAKKVRLTDDSEVPAFIELREDAQFPAGKFEAWAKKAFELPSEISLKIVSTRQDQHGFIHYKYQQFINDIPVFGAVFHVHTQQDMVVSINGKMNAGLPAVSHIISESQALIAALNHIGAETYKWEIEAEERHIKAEQNNPNATYFPEGEPIYFPAKFDYKSGELRPAYRFDIYAHEPLYRADIFVDAQTGAILFEDHRIHIADVQGTASTGYSGQRTIVTDSYGGGYRLRENGRGGGIRTYDMNEGTTYGNAVDFTDGDNNWTSTTNLDNYATDAHWGAEMTFDYYLDLHNHSSIDNNDMMILSYVHYDNNYNNAFWDGQRMTYGDGNSNNPLTTLDIVGHELTHGVTDFSADLIYQDESGALNESFSDIFGTTVEAYARPNNWDWLIGGDRGAFRSMSNPGNYGDPDTYFGNNWYTGTQDNGGVHTNSGVQNKWFYILTVGESGTNDLGDTYNVTGIGMESAGAIAYRNLTTYLTASSDYEDARFYAIQSAIDLFGACSPEVIATTNAWYAVGVGNEFDATVTSDFSANLTSSCEAPFTVEFTNLSNNGGSYNWNFGDGNTSSATNPTHTFTGYGNFTVTLETDGGTCGTATEVKPAYISVDQNNPCVALMPTSGSNTQTSCIGTLYDDGGPNNNYQDDEDVVMTIAPTGASTVTLNFNSFNFEDGYDYLYVYDGPNTGSPLIGQYDGNTLPNGGTITSSGGAITIRQYSDLYVNESGFELDWSCTMPNSPPTPNFSADPLETCNGEIQFTDESVNGATSWLWDFGDGNTSTQQNPTHTYEDAGTYTVTLTVTNSFGSNVLVRNNYIDFDKPAGPGAAGAFLCEPGTADLSVNGNGTFNWYDAASGGNLLHTGSSFTTPSLSSNTSYFVEELTSPTPQYFGPDDNSFGGGGYFAGDQHLVFDALADFTLVSVKVYAQGGGNRTIELRNNTGTVIESTTVNLPNGESRVTLNFDIPAGSNYQLGTANGSEPNLYRNNSGPAYPYTLSGIASISTSSAGNDYYYFFYDWEVQEPSCITERTEVEVEVATPPIASDVSRCGPGTVDLTASGSGTFNWFDAATGGNLVGTGSTFTTPSINNTTTYYVEGEVNAPLQYFGPQDNSFGTGGFFIYDQHLVFDCYSPFTLVSAKVYANGGGNRSFELRDNNGTVLQSAVVNVPNGESRVTLNFDVPVGTDLQLGTTDGSNPDLFRNNSGPNYPYTIPGLASITSSSAGNDYYYFFYDWEVQEPACQTNRVAVDAIIEPLPSLSLTADQEICDGESVTLQANGTNADSYSWSNGATTSSITVSPNSTTTYSVDAANSCGVATEEVTVTVNSLPTLNAPADEQICEGESVTLTASGSGNIEWTPGSETTASITVSPNSTATYTVSSSNNCGSVNEDVVVTVNELPQADAGNDVEICEGETATLTASGGGDYLWDNGETTSSIEVTPVSNTAYTVTVSQDGCADSDIVQVNVHPLPAEPFITEDGLDLVTSGGDSYQWYLNGNPIPGATDSIHTPGEPGDYTVEITDENGCSSISQPHTVMTVGIADAASGDISIYPNPSPGRFMIELGNETLQIQVFNAIGKVVYTTTSNGSRTNINAEDWSNGVYYVRITSEKISITEKLLKVK